MHITLRQLQMIVAIAEHRGLSRAARAMHVAQPSLTRSLRELEADLDVVLFERTPRGMAPTPFGEILVRRGQTIRAEIRSAEDEIDALNGGASGRVVVGVTLVGAATIVPKAVVSFAAEWSQTAVVVYDSKDNSELADRLLSGHLDFAVRPMR